MDKNKKQFNGQMPHNLEAEQSLLGCLLVDNAIQLEIANDLTKEDFYSESHQYIFEAMSRVIKSNIPLDLVSVLDDLDKHGELENAGGITYITGLTDIMPSSANYKLYFEIVKRDGLLRRLIRSSTDIIKDCQESTDGEKSLAFAEKAVFDISDSMDTSEMVKVSKVIPDVMIRIDEISKNKGATKGISTKFKSMDNNLNGLHGGELIIIAARPGVGKTTLAMNIVENVALQGLPCAVFSLEMAKEELTTRMLCSLAEINTDNLNKGIMTKREWVRLTKAKEMLNNCNVFIDESSAITPHEMISKCRRLKNRYGLSLVMVDYIQLMSSGTRRDSDNRQNEISEITRRLKIMAKELKVPVIALSQLSRSSEKEKRRPQLSDLRESGSIEQDADVVMFIHRPDKDKNSSDAKQNVAQILIEKHRNGPTGMFELYFMGECTKFKNLNVDSSEPEDDGVIKDEGGSVQPTETVKENTSNVEDEVFG